MLEPLIAVGLAADVLQIGDFMRKTLSDAHDIYKAADGASVRNKELEAASNRLQELMIELRSQNTIASNGRPDKGAFYDGTISELDRQLLALIQEADNIAKELQILLDSLKRKDGWKWASIRAAVRSAWSQDKLNDFERRLDEVRQAVNTNLLVSMR